VIIFETDRLIVRDLREQDGDNYFSIHGDPEIMRYIRPAKTREECDVLLKEHLEFNNTIRPFGRWMIETKGNRTFLGTFVIFPINDSKLYQIGYSLKKEYWGKGYASELVSKGVEYFFEHSQLSDLYAIVEMENEVSKQVLRKNGFTLDIALKENEKELIRFVRRRTDFLKVGIDTCIAMGSYFFQFFF
jgi:[ribosomal protein S5]-alanine N-acetyltransferase